MPQYFFSIRSSDAEAENDPHGTNLPDLGAALSYAERTISELQKERKYKPPGSMVIVDTLLVYRSVRHQIGQHHPCAALETGRVCHH